MKQLKDPKKLVFYIVLALIIVAGIAMTVIKGFNVELKYTANKKVDLTINQEVDVDKIQEKADEIFGKGNSIIQVTGLLKDSVRITAKEITEEQKNNLVEKVNELYPQEVAEGEESKKLLDASKVTLQGAENARLRDILNPYIIPFSIVTIVVVVYYAVRYRKLRVIKVIFKAITKILVSQLVLLSILVLIRFPMGRITTPLMLIVYTTSLVCININLMKEEKKKKLEK